MSKSIVIASQKGGVGKTTTTNALAVGLAQRGNRVLTVDLDPQCNLSFSMGANYREAATIYHVLRNEVRSQFAIQRTPIGDIIPSSFLLSGIELDFTGKYRQYLLRQALKPLQHLYDYILIDTPPGLGILTANAMVAAQHALVPCLPDSYSLQGLTQIHETISYVQNSDNPTLTVVGVVLTQVRCNRLFQKMGGVAEMICNTLDFPLLQTRIRASVALTEAQNFQENIINYNNRSNGVKDYLTLVDELLERGI